MFLIIGLGNPGALYRETKHNMGREAVGALQAHAGLPAFLFEKKWNAQRTEGKIGKEKVGLVLPDTTMNKSGHAAAAAVRFFKIKPACVFMAHDDADLTLGSTKLSFGKHSAGHKGVESVIRALKTRDFWRLRIGIGGKRDIPAEKIVLKKFSPQEQKIAKRMIKKTVAALMKAISESPERAMNEYNQ